MKGTLGRYVGAAGLARTADGGAAVGLVLLAGGHSTGGALAACLTAPHLAGPVLARSLDRSRDARIVLAGCCVVYGLALAGAAASFGSVPLVLSFVLVAVAGLCGPILTGGLSSQLAAIVPAGLISQRRSQGWDGVTYGIGGTVGPALVAAVAALSSARIALLLLAGGAVAAAGLTLTLPLRRTGERAAAAGVTPFARVLGMIFSRPGLRRVTATTMVTSLMGGGVAVLAVGLGVHLGVGANAGAVMAAAFGLGDLLGSVAVTIVPLKGDADQLIGRFAAAMGLSFLLCGLAPGYGWAVLAFGIAGFLDGPLFTATLAGRTAYSPAGGQAQLFVTMAALKVGASAVGTAGAGLFGSAGARGALIGGGMLVVLMVGLLSIDRARHPAIERQDPAIERIQ